MKIFSVARSWVLISGLLAGAPPGCTSRDEPPAKLPPAVVAPRPSGSAVVAPRPSGSAVVTHADQVAALKAAEDNLAILEQVAGGAAGTAKTKFSEEDLNTLKAAFKSYAKAPGPETYARYEDSVRNNYVVDSVMAEHLAFYLSYADEIIRDVQARPELVAKPVRTQFNYLAEDLMDIGSARSGSRVENPKASVKGKEVAAALAAAATAGNGVKKPLRR